MFIYLHDKRQGFKSTFCQRLNIEKQETLYGEELDIPLHANNLI